MEPLYLNNAATSFPKPDPVIQTVTAHLGSLPAEHHRSSSAGGTDAVEECRRACAEFFHAPAASIFLSPGATFSLNTLIHGLCRQGDHIVFTARAHNSVIRPLEELVRRGTITTTVIGTDKSGTVSPEDIAAAVQPDTRAVFLNHASNVTGTLTDIEAVRDRVPGPFLIVDASQSAGLIGIDVSKLRIDALVFTGHKYLFGLPGTGGMYLREGIDFDPLVTGGTGVLSESLRHPRVRPFVYEPGTPNAPGFAALTAGIRFIQKTGFTRLRQSVDSVFSYLIERITQLGGIIPVGIGGNHGGMQRTPVLSFIIPDLSSEEAGYIYAESFEIKVRSGLHCAPLIHQFIGSAPEGTIRISLSFFTSKQDIDRFIVATRAITEQCV